MPAQTPTSPSPPTTHTPRGPCRPPHRPPDEAPTPVPTTTTRTSRAQSRQHRLAPSHQRRRDSSTSREPSRLLLPHSSIEPTTEGPRPPRTPAPSRQHHPPDTAHMREDRPLRPMLSISTSRGQSRRLRHHSSSSIIAQSHRLLHRNSSTTEQSHPLRHRSSSTTEQSRLHHRGSISRGPSLLRRHRSTAHATGFLRRPPIDKQRLPRHPSRSALTQEQCRQLPRSGSSRVPYLQHPPSSTAHTIVVHHHPHINSSSRVAAPRPPRRSSRISMMIPKTTKGRLRLHRRTVSLTIRIEQSHLHRRHQIASPLLSRPHQIPRNSRLPLSPTL